MKGQGILLRIVEIIFVSALALGATVASARPSGLLMFGARGERESLDQFCAHLPGCAAIDEKTEEFSNGDTFVRVKTELTGQRVGVLIPSKMNPQTFMELLIKIRTAKTLGARKIIAFMESDPRKTEIASDAGALNLPVESFLGVAGVETIVVRGQLSRPATIEALSTPREDLTHSFIVERGHETVARDIQQILKVPLYKGNTAFSQPVMGAQISYVSPVVIPKSETFFRSLSQIRKWTQRGAAVTWITPLPWARSDKADQKGVTVIGRLVADLTESVGTEAVLFARAHAPQSQGFFKIPSFNVLGLETLSAYLRDQHVEMIVSPDTGFQKDATLYADLLKLPIAVANKQRDPLTAQTKFYGFSGPSPAGKVVAIVDDETSTGGTLAEVADYLKKAGSAKVIAVVTHLAGDGSKALNSGAIDQMVVTDSYPVPQSRRAIDKLVVVPIGKELGRSLEHMVVTPEECADLLNNAPEVKK